MELIFFILKAQLMLSLVIAMFGFASDALRYIENNKDRFRIGGLFHRNTLVFSAA